MFEICEHLSVCRKDMFLDGFIVEDCAGFDEVLDGIIIVCREHEMENVKAWIRGNMRTNAEHCLKMFEKNPAKVLEYICVSKGISCYTEEMVKSLGGVQEFLDKYAAAAPVSQGPAARPPAVENVDGDTGVGDGSGWFGSYMNPPVESAAEEPAGQVQKEQAGQACEEPSPPVFTRTEVEVVNVKVKKKVYEIQEFDPNLIEEITDEHILDSLAKLRQLNSQIALDGLDPDLVLDDDRMKRAHEMLEAYPPAVFKGFLLNMITGVCNNIERMRVSSLLDDFATYISRKSGGCNE